MIKNEIKKILNIPEAEIERPESESFGDYSTNVALKLAKKEKRNPMEITQILVDKLLSYKGSKEYFEKIEVAKPGFINFFISKEYLQKQVVEILEKGEQYSQVNIGQGQKLLVEFLGANPTGPLTLANGRGGFYGDALSNVLAEAGYKVEREYWVNNTGHQVEILGHSILEDKKAVYKGRYIEELKKRIKTNSKTPLVIGEEVASIILEEMIRPAVKQKMKIKFDNWSIEKDLHISSQIKKVIDWLKEKNLVYEKEGAVWFQSTKFGDEKDRVLITSKETEKSEEPTYFAADIAYHKTKLDREYEKLINIWGADHHGYITRLKAAVKALGYQGVLDIIIMQLVRLFQGGKEVRMSKRTGTYVTIDELIDEVGLDVARFFFLMYSSNTHMDFNLDLAKEQSEKNPVYYVQYAYARISSILRKAQNNFQFPCGLPLPVGLISNFQLLGDPSELDLIKQLIRLPEIIEDTANDYQVQRLPQYALELVRTFHKFYEECRVIDEKNPDLTQARLGLVEATRIVLKNTLDLMGISTPERM